MGIKNLSTLLADNCPKCFREDKLVNYFNRKIAIDANMSMYQFLISIRGTGADLANDQGEVTSHLQGLLYRTTKMLDQGLKPLFVFDGKPPEMKMKELQKRKEKVEEAKKEQEKAAEDGDEEKAIMFSKRTIRVTKEQTEDAKKLLRLMGVPVVEAPSEAESQCAELNKGGVVFATGTEDMDSLTFGTPILLRHLTYSEARKEPIREYHLEKILEGLELTMDQFIDVCILCGCDYCPTIRGIGPKKALSLIKDHKNIEGVIKAVEGKKGFSVPDDFNYELARKLFKEPDVIPASQVLPKWTDPKEEELVDFLVKEKQFDETKVRNAIAKIKNSRKKAGQHRITSFFKIEPKASNPSADSSKNPKKSVASKRKRTNDSTNETEGKSKKSKNKK